MKVCMIYYSYFNTLFKRDANAHLERGDEVDVFCYTLRNGEISISSPRLSVHTLMKRGFDEKHPTKYLLKIGYFFIVALIKVSVLHFKKGFDLIHVVSPPDFMIFAAIIPKLLGAKIVVNIHDIVPEFYMRKFGVKEDHIVVKILRLVEKFCCRVSDHVFTVTEIWKDKLIRRTGISESKCNVLMNVPDGDILELIKKKEIVRSSDFRLLYPGNLGEHFGVETLIRAMPLVKVAVPSVRLDIYGDGHQREYLQNLVRILDVEEITNFHSYIPIEELFKVMQETDIGIVPTMDGIFAGEALSTKSLEFMSVGVPMIISRTESSQYYYKDSMVMFFKPGDPKDLARCIIDLYENPEKREGLVRNAESFNVRHNWKYYKEAYYKVVGNL